MSWFERVLEAFLEPTPGWTLLLIGLVLMVITISRKPQFWFPDHKTGFWLLATVFSSLIVGGLVWQLINAFRHAQAG